MRPAQIIVCDVVFRVDPYELVVVGDGLLILLNGLTTLLNFEIIQRCSLVFPDNFFVNVHGLAVLATFEEIIGLFSQKSVLSLSSTITHY